MKVIGEGKMKVIENGKRESHTPDDPRRGSADLSYSIGVL